MYHLRRRIRRTTHAGRSAPAVRAVIPWARGGMVAAGSGRARVFACWPHRRLDGIWRALRPTPWAPCSTVAQDLPVAPSGCGAARILRWRPGPPVVLELRCPSAQHRAPRRVRRFPPPHRQVKTEADAGRLSPPDLFPGGVRPAPVRGCGGASWCRSWPTREVGRPLAGGGAWGHQPGRGGRALRPLLDHGLTSRRPHFTVVPGGDPVRCAGSMVGSSADPLPCGLAALSWSSSSGSRVTHWRGGTRTRARLLAAELASAGSPLACPSGARGGGLDWPAPPYMHLRPCAVGAPWF